MSILNGHCPSFIQNLTVAIIIAANAFACTGNDIPLEREIANSRLLSAHLAIANCEVRIAEATLEQASQRADRSKTLHDAGNASWIEWQQADLRRRLTENQLLAAVKLRDWLQTETQKAIDSPRNITHASVLLRLPQSDVPIGWITFHGRPGAPNDHTVSREFVSALVAAPAPSHAAALMLRRKAIEHRLQVLMSETPSSLQLDFSRQELQLCVAQLDLDSARADLLRIQFEIVSRIFACDVNPHSQPSVSRNHCSHSDQHGADQIVLAALKAEIQHSATTMLSDVEEWSLDLLSRTSLAQKSGFVSTARLLQHRQQSLASHQSLVGATEFQTWKNSWLDRMSEDRQIPTLAERSSADAEIHSVVCSELSQMSNISVMEMLIETMRLELSLQSELNVIRNQVRFGEQLQQRLLQQARPNPNEVAECARLRRIAQLSAESLSNRVNVLSWIAANGMTLETQVSQGDSLQLVDSEVLDVLIRSEQINIQMNDETRLTHATRKASRRMEVLEQLQKQGLASPDEITQLEIDLLELQYEKQLDQQKKTRSDAILNILTSQQRELSRLP